MTLQSNSFFACDALSLLERLPSDAVTLAYLNPPWDANSWQKSYPRDTPEWSDEQYASYLSKIVQQVRRLLTNDGSLFLHWSPMSLLDVRLLINQAFSDQPKYEITLQRKRLGNLASKGPKMDSEFLLVYSKANDFIYNPLFRPLSSEDQSPYKFSDDRGLYRLGELTSPFDRPQARFSWRGHQPPVKRSWRYSLSKLDALEQDGRIQFSTSAGIPRIKQYLADSPGIEVGTTWTDIPSIIPGQEREEYSTQTPLALMERIIQLASNTGNQVLDPFCGSGTTLIAAHSLRRSWCGAEVSEEAQQIVQDRLRTEFALQAEKDYVFCAEDEVLQRPIVCLSYRDVILSIAEIAVLQKETIALTDHLLSLKKLMNISELEGDRVETAIEQMQHWITTSVANQSKSLESYIDVVCAWLTGWERLDVASQSFLPQAELLFESIARNSGQDYSPFIIQYCRALENELLTKVFIAYTDDLYHRCGDVRKFLAKDIEDLKTERFAKSLVRRENAYTLGEMNFNMSLLKVNGQTLGGSPLLQDFRNFAVRYFGERIVDKQYLDQLDRINKDFRCKAAHPYVLDSEIAERCRDQVRSCLNELILNYKGTASGSGS